jgi:hypothetical protein
MVIMAYFLPSRSVSMKMATSLRNMPWRCALGGWSEIPTSAANGSGRVVRENALLEFVIDRLAQQRDRFRDRPALKVIEYLAQTYAEHSCRARFR